MNQYNEWRSDDAPLYQPSAKPVRGTGYPPHQPPQWEPQPGEPTDDQLRQYGRSRRPRSRFATYARVFFSVIIGGLALLILFILIFTPSAKPPAVQVVEPTPTVAQAVPSAPPVVVVPPKAQAPRLAPGVFGDGTYEVGRGPGLIEPGKYRYEGGAAIAYWARLRDTSGETNSIIANGNATGPTTITIKKTDGAVQFMGDATWQRIS